MTLRKRFKTAILALVLAAAALEGAGWLGLPGFEGGAVTRAHAVVGRPLTPVSVAGVGRRTTRRCVTGVYNC